MAYLTQIPGAVLTVDEVSAAQLVELPSTAVLNDLNTSQEIESYNVQEDSNGPGTLAQGDYLAPVVGGSDVPGQYIGSGVIENAGLTLGSMTDSGLGGIAALGIQVSVNPITGDYFADEAGNVYFISEEPLSADRIMASISVNLPGTNNIATLEVPVSELTDTLSQLDPTGLLGTLLGDVTNLSQYVMDTALLTSTTDPNATMDLEDFNVVCFTRGTLIMTEHGLRKIEELKVGDRVLTRDNGLKAINWIGMNKVSAATLVAHPNLRPIRIKAGALGQNIPETDLIVSPQHRVLVRSKIARRMFDVDEVLTAAKHLCQIDGIEIAEDMREVEYFHMLFDQHEVVFSNGAETESMYMGPQALKSVGKEALDEILTLFPALRDSRDLPPAARIFLNGKMGRKLAMRHAKNSKPLVSLTA